MANTTTVTRNPVEVDKAVAKYDGPMPYSEYKKIPEEMFQVRDTGGLGHYKLDQSNPNYDSIYDEWDFDTKAPLALNSIGNSSILPTVENWAAKNFMQRVGKPFAVYERIPKESLNYPVTTNEGQDVNLPDEPKQSYTINPYRKVRK
jgi:hypothetical protein